MKRYDRFCPACGRLNRALYLEETGGWMECERCGILANVGLPQAVYAEQNPSVKRQAAKCAAAG